MRLKLTLIALGGGVGAALRYLVTGWSQRLVPGTFPVGTLAVNVAGCFAIGLLNFVLLGPVLVREEVRLALVTGVLGGFTTFSSYGWETLALTNEGAWLAAGANVALNNGLGFLAAWVAYRLAELLFGVA
jgi:CrcB protein